MTGSLVSAALWGALAASSLIIGAVLAVRARLSNRVIGSVMGFGAGALIGAIAYELVPDSLISGAGKEIFAAFAAGTLTFYVCDRLIDDRGGRHRKKIAGGLPAGEGSGAAIFLGTLLDGIPESLTLGLGLALGGAISVAFLAAVFVSNIPEGIAGTHSLLREGHSRRQVLWMWIGLVIGSAAAAALGYAAVQFGSISDGRLIQGFAAGGVLIMLADAMMPEAFEHGGKVVGLLTTLGFLTAAILSVLE
jgi:ZIP family zinc transporter